MKTAKKDTAPKLITERCMIEPSRDEISRTAYGIWEKEGRPEGCELAHWLQAEAELRHVPHAAIAL